MTWCYETLRDLTAERFNIDVDDINYGTVLYQLDIDPEEYADFLLTLADDIASEGIFKLKDEGNLRLEIRSDKSMADIVGNAVK